MQVRAVMIERGEIFAAEGAVGGGFADGILRRAACLRAVDEDAIGGDVEVAFLIGAQTVGYAVDAGEEDAVVGGVAGGSRSNAWMVC